MRKKCGSFWIKNLNHYFLTCYSNFITKTFHIFIEMGKMFGNLAHISGIITYSLSPFEQRAFAGAISHGIPNMWFRFRSQALRVLPRK